MPNAELLDRIRKRVELERGYAENNRVVAELLQPQLDAFDRRDGTHNTYAVRMQLDHRNSAKKDAQFADDLAALLDFVENAIK